MLVRDTEYVTGHELTGAIADLYPRPHPAVRDRGLFVCKRAYKMHQGLVTV